MALSRFIGLSAGMLLAAAATSVTAHAVPVTFDFTSGGGAQAPSMDFPSGGVNLTVSSNRTNFLGTRVATDGRVGHWSNGLGIYNNRTGDQHLIDGNNGNEVMGFYFDQAVKLVSITFSYSDANDNFAFFFDRGNDGGLAGDLVWGRKDMQDSFLATYFFTASESAAAIGRLFGIGAYDNNDEFKIASITVNSAVSAVPIPGALPLLLSALGAMGWGARRRLKKGLKTGA